MSGGVGVPGRPARERFVIDVVFGEADDAKTLGFGDHATPGIEPMCSKTNMIVY
jgi:hypothetical protein